MSVTPCCGAMADLVNAKYGPHFGALLPTGTRESSGDAEVDAYGPHLVWRGGTEDLRLLIRWCPFCGQRLLEKSPKKSTR